MTLVTILIYLLILAVLVIVHELGHFLVAKLFRVRVEEFGIGFPPRLVKLGRWLETDFVLNLIPLGGYVNLSGENAPAQPGTETTDGEFYTKPAWQRFLVILAGPLVNLVLAAIVFMIAYSVYGIPREVPGMVFIDYLEPGSPADRLQLPVGARIVSVADASSSLQVQQMEDVAGFTRERLGSEISITLDDSCSNSVCSDNLATYEARLRGAEEIPAGGGALGIAMTNYQDFHYPWYQQLPYSVYYGGRQSLRLSWQMLQGLGVALRQLFSREPKQAVLMGPVGIVGELARAKTFQQGLMEIVSFAGFLSLNLGIINLLPIPAVDGGRLFLIICEKAFGRARIAKVEGMLNYIGFIGIMILAALITIADVMRLTKGG